MAYKRLVTDVISDYETGGYNNISEFYELIIDSVNIQYNSDSDLCLDDVFAITPTLNSTTCTSVWEQARLLLYSQYTQSQMILAFELFGYDYAFYIDSCNDHGGCLCDNRNFNGRNILSKRKYGVLTDNGYLDNNFSREYLMQVEYDESENCLYISDEHSKTNPAYNPAYLTLNPAFYRNKLLVTYIGFDVDNAKFIEQIIFSGDHEIDGIWKYNLGEAPCNINNTDCQINDTEEVDNMTVIVGYVNDLGFLSETQVTYPVIYTKYINIEDGKTKLDGIYKTYYFNIPYLTEMLVDATYVGQRVFLKGEIYYFEYLDIDGNLIKEYRKAKYDLSIDSTTSTAVNVVTPYYSNNYDLTSNTGLLDFATDNFETVLDIDYLKNLGTFKNIIHNSTSLSIEGYVGEDAHLITYNLRDNIIDSIEGCEIPCEKFSYDTWMALMQKKMAASIAFCNNNLQESARIMSTIDERCKNCD